MSSTVYDDVFRTIVYKMPYLVVPLINEAFGTNYPDDVSIERLQNESFDSEAVNERITDTYLKIGGHIYHIECQSNEDGSIVLRMIEYDFRIALEGAEKEDDTVTLRFPRSMVLYLRGWNKASGQRECLEEINRKKDPDSLKARVILPDGNEFIYTVPRISVMEYDTDHIFEKKLIMFLPFYIMRYEKQFAQIEQDKSALEELLKEYQNISDRLYNVIEGQDRDLIYRDLIGHITLIADHLLEKHDHIREEVHKAMGGQILELESERLIRIGKEQGMELGRAQGIEQGVAALASLVDDGMLTAKEAATRLGLSFEEYTRIAERISD